MQQRYHQIPTHLNVEDKLVFGLTVKQFLYVLVGSSVAYSVWDQAGDWAVALRAALAIACLLIAAAFALLRLGGRPVEEWLAAALLYVASARRATWHAPEPELADWRPPNESWQELALDLAWAEEAEPAWR